jgi:hypothetical protein
MRIYPHTTPDETGAPTEDCPIDFRAWTPVKSKETFTNENPKNGYLDVFVLAICALPRESAGEFKRTTFYLNYKDYEIQAIVDYLYPFIKPEDLEKEYTFSVLRRLITRVVDAYADIRSSPEG